VRVALVGPYSSPGRAKGGVESSFQNLLAGLASHGDLTLDVLTFAQAATPGDGADANGVRVHRLAAPKRFNNLTFYRGSRRVLGCALEELRPEIVHAQDALGHGYVCLRTVRNVPVVVSVHGIVRETRNQLTSPRDRLQVTLAGVAVERYCVRHAEFLLQPTPYPEEYFGEEVGGRIVDVGNAVADGLFALDPRPEPGRVLYAGGITPGKRVLDLVEAASRVPEVSLRLAGGAPEPAYATAVARRIRTHDLEGRVALLGQLDTGQMLDEYRRAAVLVLPSAQETSPMVIAEAMAAGVPVVATRVGGVPHLVEDGRTGVLVTVGDIDALAQRLTELLGDERTRRSFAAAARSRAEQFRVATVAARVRNVYEEAVG
jgi:glycosyltransferase involved in cell wall biosynthesis